MSNKESDTKILRAWVGRGRARATQWIFAHPVPTLAIAVVLFYLVITFGSGIFAGIRYAFQDAEVQKLEQKSDASEAKTNDLVNQADDAKVDRKAEDLNRAQNIRPRLEASSRSVDAARTNTETARREYEKARTTRDDLNSDARTLHDRNCSNLRELYPGEDLAFCK